MPSARPEAHDRTARIRRVLLGLLVANLAVVVAKLDVGLASRSRGGAQAKYAEVTIAVDRETNVAAAHAIADEVERRLERDLQFAEVTVHIEPC